MKKTVYSLIAILLIFNIVGCSTVNIESVEASANQAFEKQDFSEFNKQYEILLKVNKDEATKYLKKIEENKLFDVESYHSDYKKGIKLFENINMNVPSLKNIANEKLDIIKCDQNLKQIISSIKTNQLDKLDSPVDNDVYELPPVLG